MFDIFEVCDHTENENGTKNKLFEPVAVCMDPQEPTGISFKLYSCKLV